MPLDKNLKVVDKAIDSITTAAKKEIIKAYAESLNSVRSTMSFIYEKYSTDGTLSYADMTKYNRLVELEKEISSELVGLTGKSGKMIKSLSSEVYQEAYFRTAFALEHEVQAKLAYGMLNNKVIEASIQNPLSGLTLNERLVKNRSNIILEIRQQITQGLIQGESYPKMAKRIKTSLEGNASKALRVVQTEAHRVQIEGRLGSMEHAVNKGVRMVKVWVATLDERVRESHIELDGQKVEMDENFVIGSFSAPAPGMFGVASEDIGCRCSIRPEIEGYEPELRRSRYEGAIPYSTYKEWRQNRLSF